MPKDILKYKVTTDYHRQWVSTLIYRGTELKLFACMLQVKITLHQVI